MLNSIARASRTCWQSPVISGSLVYRVQTYAAFTVRDILHENSDDSGTLLSRFAKHIAMEQHVYLPILPTTISYSNYFPVTDQSYFKKELQKTPAEQIPALIIFAFTYRSNAEPNKFAFVLNELDDAAVRNLPEMSDDTALRTLYAFLYLMPTWISRTGFYRAAVKHLAVQEFTKDTPKEKFVQMCFYLGLTKKHNADRSSSLQQLLAQHLDRYLPSLSTMDLAVVSSAAFKTATPVHSAAYNERLEKAACGMTLDGFNDALMVTFVKAMRFQRVRSENVCKHLTSLCSNKIALRALQPSGIVHLLAYFSENLWDHYECLQWLVNEFMERIDPKVVFSARSGGVRGKDYAIFLWSCAQLNCLQHDTSLQRIEEILLKKFHNDEFRYFPDQLVDCCLSLWMLGYKSRPLLREAVNLKLSSGPGARQQPKVDSRLTVLLTASSIETPKWTLNLVARSEKRFNLHAPIPAYLMKGRSDLTEYVNKLALEENVSEAKLVCPLIGINIPGLSVQLNNGNAKTEYLVEILTSDQILRFSKDPVALLRLKMRLLAALNYKTALVRPSDLQNNYTCFKDLVITDADPAEVATKLEAKL